MGRIINPRGTSGAGKTWLVREVMAVYRREGAGAEPLHHPGRSRPMGFLLDHPRGGSSLAVIGHYEATRGGTDTIPVVDGGLDGAFRLADALAGAGHDVLLEGLQLSGDVARTVALARAQQARGGGFHVLLLDASAHEGARNVAARRRAARRDLPAIERTARLNSAATDAACAALGRTGVDVEVLQSPAALRRTLALLGMDLGHGPGAWTWAMDPEPARGVARVCGGASVAALPKRRARVRLLRGAATTGGGAGHAHRGMMEAAPAIPANAGER